MKVLFYTCIFSTPGEAPQDTPGVFTRVAPVSAGSCLYDYICLTNVPDLPATSWRLVHVDMPPALGPRIFSRMIKFDPWTHVPNAGAYSVLVYMDVWRAPLPKPSLWASVVARLLGPACDLIVHPRRSLPCDSMIYETAERKNLMMSYLRDHGVDPLSPDVPTF